MKDICAYTLDKEATTRRFFDICNFYNIKNKDLVKLFNVSNATVSYWRNGTRFPGWDKLMLFAYAVALPLDVMVIGKSNIEDEQIIKAINKINNLKHEKYLARLQDLLDKGELDNPPCNTEIIFNPLNDKKKSSEWDSTIYSRLISDVKYYGLEKKTKIKTFSNSVYMPKLIDKQKEVKKIQRDNQKEIKYKDNPENPKECWILEENAESKSLYININGKTNQIIDEYGNPINGWRIDSDAYDKDKKIIILRFRNGFLDGDEYDKDGNYLGTRPAVESSGHIEYWRCGRLHRDNKEAAVISNGFRTYEFWQDGKKLK